MSAPGKNIGSIDSKDSCPGTSSAASPIKLPKFSLHAHVIEACKFKKFPKPNNVQREVLPYFMEPFYEDLIICSPRQTGKTISFILGILNNFLEKENQFLAIILAPTCNIAEASYSCCKDLAHFCNVIVHFLSKGKSSAVKIDKRKTIVISTPDKILDLSQSSAINLKKVSFLVIDEVDCLRNPKKYFDDTLKIHEKLHRSCRTIVCTSTINDAINEFVNAHLYNPINIIVKEEVTRKYPIEKLCLIFSSRALQLKVEALEYLINMEHSQGQIVIFCETKDKASDLKQILQNDEIEAILLTGELSYNSIKKVIEEFKNGIIKVIITTRTFANDLPINSCTKLVHYDQALDVNQKLDASAYIKRESLLSRLEKCVEVIFIEDIWIAHLFDQSFLVNEGSYFKNLRKIKCDEIKTYFT